VSLVPPFFAQTPVAHLLGPDIEATDRNDACLDRTLDWLSTQDLTQARTIVGVSARHVPVETTSCSVRGASVRDASADSEASMIAITSGFSRDHQDNLKPWMLAPATTKAGRGAAVRAPTRWQQQ